MFQHVPVIRCGTYSKAFKGRRHLFPGRGRSWPNNANDMIELDEEHGPAAEVRYQDPLSMSAEKVVEMHTIDGARAIGMENEIGSIEAGKKADMVIFDPYECQAVLFTTHAPPWCTRASLKNITDVYVDGRAVMEKGVILTVEDEKTELWAAQKAAEALARGNITNRLEGHKWGMILIENMRGSKD